MLPCCAKLFGKVGDLLAEIGSVVTPIAELFLPFGDDGLGRFQLLLQITALYFQLFNLVHNNPPPIGQSRLLGGDIFAFDFDRTDGVVRLCELAHQIENGRFMLLHFAVEIVERQLPVSKCSLTFFDQFAMAVELLRQLRERAGFFIQRSRGDVGLFRQCRQIPLELPDLIGDLFQLLPGVMLALFGRLHRRFRLHQIVFDLLALLR